MKKELHKYIVLILMQFISALNFNFLLKPINLVAGGTSGLSLIIEELFGLESSTFITIAYIVTFIMSVLLLGKKSIIGLLVASVSYPVFVNLTEPLTSLVKIDYSDLILISSFSGIIAGISNGYIYKYDFPSSGISVIGPIIQKYFKISISKVLFVMNMIIVLLGGYYFSIDMILYSIILLYINRIICDRIILGISDSKALFIRTQNNDLVINFFKNKHNISVTKMNCNGGHMIMATVPTNQYFKIKEELRIIDKEIFYVTNDVYELVNK